MNKCNKLVFNWFETEMIIFFFFKNIIKIGTLELVRKWRAFLSLTLINVLILSSTSVGSNKCLYHETFNFFHCLLYCSNTRYFFTKNPFLKVSFYIILYLFLKDVKSTWMRERENILLSSWVLMGKSLIQKAVGSSHLVKIMFYYQVRS